jgi:hypothetical protein
MALTYSNGRTGGMGYMEVWPYTYQIVSGIAEARESFTVSGGDRTVSTVGLRLMRVSGTSPLVLRLETSTGTEIETVSVPAASIPVRVPGQDGNAGSTWVTASFTRSQVLASGQSYNLVLSAAADTSYSVFAIRQGSSYGYPATTYFEDGVAQYNDGAGAGWEYFGYGSTHLNQGDLQFYFR